MFTRGVANSSSISAESTPPASRIKERLLRNPMESPLAAPVAAVDATPPESSTVCYALKRVAFQGRSVTIVLQSDNGPCPLLAIVNCLILRGGLMLSNPAAEYIEENDLLAQFREYLLRTNAHNTEGDGGGIADDANKQTVLRDALSLLQTLSRGLDVNLRFNDVEQFEYTPQLSTFDVAGVRLFHGWCYDPQEPVAAHLGSLTYNQAIEKIIAGQSGDQTAPAAAAGIAVAGISITDAVAACGHESDNRTSIDMPVTDSSVANESGRASDAVDPASSGGHESQSSTGDSDASTK